MKLIYDEVNGREELYDLCRDPEERHDLSLVPAGEGVGEARARLRKEVRSLAARHPDSVPPSETNAAGRARGAPSARLRRRRGTGTAAMTARYDMAVAMALSPPPRKQLPYSSTRTGIATSGESRHEEATEEATDLVSPLLGRWAALHLLLAYYWPDDPFGDAVEAKKGGGVAWLTPNGDLLAVEFDDVAYNSDNQTLELPNGDTVTARVARGKVTVRRKHPDGKTRAA